MSHLVVAALAVVVWTFAVDASAFDEVEIESVAVVPGQDHFLQVVTRSCRADIYTEVEESTRQVLVRAFAKDSEAGLDCLDLSLAILELPLQDRRVVDTTTGRVLLDTP